MQTRQRASQTPLGETGDPQALVLRFRIFQAKAIAAQVFDNSENLAMCCGARVDP